MHNLDASAASSCFLQLAKLCQKRGIFLCAAGVLPRVEWMLRSHHVAFGFEDEVDIKKSILSNIEGHWEQPVFAKLILFMTLFEVSDEYSEYAHVGTSTSSQHIIYEGARIL
jgi:hypothetical protein